jgi:hypothetical protein
LTDFESTRKSAVTEEYLDLCNDCYATIRDHVKALERFDLMTLDDEPDEDDIDFE